MTVIKSGHLKWISKKEFLCPPELPICINDVIYKDNKLYFLNHEKYKNFSPFFSYDINKYYCIKCKPEYQKLCFHCKKYVAGISIGEKYLIACEKKNMLKFYLADSKEDKCKPYKKCLNEKSFCNKPCCNKSCCNKPKKCDKRVFECCKEIDNLYCHILNAIYDYECSDYIDVTFESIALIESCKLLLFSLNDGDGNFYIVMGKYSLNGCELKIEKCDMKVYKYNLCSIAKKYCINKTLKLEDICYDDDGSLLILTSYCDDSYQGGYLWHLKWFDKLKLLSCTLKPALGECCNNYITPYDLGCKPKCFTFLNCNDIIIVYDKIYNNKFYYEILKL